MHARALHSITSHRTAIQQTRIVTPPVYVHTAHTAHTPYSRTAHTPYISIHLPSVCAVHKLELFAKFDFKGTELKFQGNGKNPVGQNLELVGGAKSFEVMRGRANVRTT